MGRASCAASRAGRGSVEYRMPLALVGRALGHLPLGVGQGVAHLFADAVTLGRPGRRRASPTSLRRT